MYTHEHVGELKRSVGSDTVRIKAVSKEEMDLSVGLKPRQHKQHNPSTANC